MIELIAIAAGAIAGLALGGGLALALGPALLRRRSGAGTPSRGVVQLAIRLAQRGQRILLVETGSRLCLARPEHAELPNLRILASLAGGALVVARSRLNG